MGSCCSVCKDHDGKDGDENRQMDTTSDTKNPNIICPKHQIKVSKLGFGCMSLTGIYNSPLSEEDGISVIKHAFSKGITFFDTSDAYGPQTNEILLGKALKQLPREKIQIATKFGIQRTTFPNLQVNGSPEYVRSCCEASLKRLDVQYIDLYYQHRVDTKVPIEETVGELKKLVEEGKVKYIGLSEASPDTIRRAHAVHPITAVQMEWSPWSRDVEEEIIPLCRELGIGIVPYSPLGRGFFAGKRVEETLAANSSLSMHPRFQGENLDKNNAIYSRIESQARKHQCTPAQLALAWVFKQGEDVAPIPGTRKAAEDSIQYNGLSEPSPDTIRREHAVHPITALQMEWSLWARDIKKEIIPLCRDGIGIVPYSPLDRGFFAGRVVENLAANSLLDIHPRFQGENLDKNKTIYSRIESLARKNQCTPAQLALQWVLQQGDDVVPIPGTTKIKNLDDNIGYLKVKLTEEDLKEISDALYQ